MWIKICANTNLADAQLAADLGADAVGFVFAPSKRRVNAEQVAEITRQLPARIEKVGVFSTTDAGEIARTAAAAGLTAIQLHSAFDPRLIASLSAQCGDALKLIQTIPYEVDFSYHAAFGAANPDERFETALVHAFAQPALRAVLIDAAQAGASGGLGVAFDWARAAQILARVHAAHLSSNSRPRVILAGGLRVRNVSAAIATLHPWGVDVASGVEASPGRKDPERLRQFLAAARQSRHLPLAGSAPRV